jgi:hypothetical protein
MSDASSGTYRGSLHSSSRPSLTNRLRPRLPSRASYLTGIADEDNPHSLGERPQRAPCGSPGRRRA